VALTLHFVAFARILFRADDLAGAWAYARALGAWSLAPPRFSYTALGVLVAGFALHYTPDRWERSLQETFVRGGPLTWALGLLAVGVACATFGGGESLSFIYYAF
jgi:hypothetical protein